MNSRVADAYHTEKNTELPIEIQENVEIREQNPVVITEINNKKEPAEKDYKIGEKIDLDLSEVEQISDVQKSSARSSITELHGSEQGYLNGTDDAKMYYLEGINSGVLIQARLRQPAEENIDYDLYILDSQGYILTASENYTYLNGNYTCPESVSYINLSSEVQDYYFYVHSSAGGSLSETYTIEYSISYLYDVYEPNDAIRDAAGFTVTSDGVTIDNASISTPIDTDWYIMTIPENRIYNQLMFSLTANSVNKCLVEVYDDINGYYQLRKKLSGNGTLNVQAGTYYIRVSYAGTELDKFKSDAVEDYTLKIRPILIPDKIIIKGYDCSNANAGYASYPQGYYYRAVGNIEIRGFVTATDKETNTTYAVENANVTAQIYNTAYNQFEYPYFYLREVTDQYTESDGSYRISLSLAPCQDSFQYSAAVYIHAYDMLLVRVFVTDKPSVQKTDYIYQLGSIMY